MSSSATQRFSASSPELLSLGRGSSDGRVFAGSLRESSSLRSSSSQFRASLHEISESGNVGLAGGPSAAGSDVVEISRDQALQELLSNPELSDVSLKGSDGGLPVHANRCMLAARSPVFYRMLYGGFAESERPVVQIGYQSAVVKAMVEYIYTNDASFFHKPLDEMSTRQLVWTLVALADGAHFFALTELCRKTERKANALLHAYPSIAGIFLVACEEFVGSTGVLGLTELALKTLRVKPESLLADDGALLAPLSERRVEWLLQDDQLQADEFTRFQIVATWSNVIPSSAPATPPPGDAAAERETSSGSIQQMIDPPADEESVTGHDDASALLAKRKQIAAKLTEHIQLEHIDPLHLRNVVKPSGLIALERLLHAFESQACTAQSQHGILFQKPRFPVWKTSNAVCLEETSHDPSIETLLCDPLQIGQVHRWSILIERHSPLVYLGVVSVALTDPGTEERAATSRTSTLAYNNNKWLGTQPGGWAYSSAGIGWHADRRVGLGLRKFGENSTVTLILDLTDQGTLHASVDGNRVFLLFSNMLRDASEAASQSSTTTAEAAAAAGGRAAPNDSVVVEGQNDQGDERSETGGGGGGGDDAAVALAFLPAVSLKRPGRVRFLGFDAVAAAAEPSTTTT